MIGSQIWNKMQRLLLQLNLLKLMSQKRKLSHKCLILHHRTRRKALLSNSRHQVRRNHRFRSSMRSIWVVRLQFLLLHRSKSICLLSRRDLHQLHQVMSPWWSSIVQSTHQTFGWTRNKSKSKGIKREIWIRWNCLRSSRARRNKSQAVALRKIHNNQRALKATSRCNSVRSNSKSRKLNKILKKYFSKLDLFHQLLRLIHRKMKMISWWLNVHKSTPISNKS